MRHFLFFLTILTTSWTWSQATEKYQGPNAGFYRAEELFEKEQYSAARKEFRQFVSDYKGSKDDPFYVKALYYEGLSALELFNNDAIPLLEQFNRDYPESIYRNEIFFRIGRYYYQKKDYKKTLEWFAQVNRAQLETENLDEFNFKTGYANFYTKNYPEAKTAFYEVKASTSQYGAPALYYYSHICYIDGSYQSALEGFQSLMSDDRFRAVVPYYITQIYYLQGNYESVTTFAPPLVDSLKPAEQVEMNHLIGDAYYKQTKYEEAIPYLERYSGKAATSRDDDYQLAYAYFKSTVYDKAVKYFDKVARVKDTLGQIALYHAGECYMNLNELVYARTAFDAASQLDMDQLIQEDALFNFAILSYKLDLNPYDEAVEALERYLNKYPESPRKDVVYQYLVNVYTSTKNYQKALQSLDRMPKKDLRLKSAYQLIAYNRGVELYQKKQYVEAIEAFKLVATYPVDADLSARAVFWTADANFVLSQGKDNTDGYRRAIQGYHTFLAMPSNHLSGLRADAYYNLGYAHLELKEHEQTKEAFRQYLQQPGLANMPKKADATMRLADEYYIIVGDATAPKTAIDYYLQVYNMKSGHEDQALYYMARCYGFEGNRDEKIRRMLELINNYPKSTYLQRAIYDVGMTYYNTGLDDDKALRYFEQILKDYPNSILVKDVLHYVGDIYRRKGDYVKAENYVKRILNEYGNERSTCVREVTLLSEIYEAQRQMGKVEQLLTIYPCADSLKFELEDKYFNFVKEAYDNERYPNVITEAETYLTKYPTGKFRSEVMNYQAFSMYKLGREADAVAIYRQTLDGPNDDFTELAAQRTAKFLYNGGNFEAALPYYARLEQVATDPEMIHLARLGLMRCHFLLENFTNSAEYAEKVLTNTQLTASVRLEAEFTKGMSLAKTDRFGSALVSLEYVIKNTTTALGAEAKYTIAECYFKAADMDKSEKAIRELLKMKPGYDYWIAKSLILQTKVLISKSDLFQAENTILSVLDNYPVKDDGIMTEAGELYDEIVQMKSEPKKLQEGGDNGTVIEVPETKEQK